MNIIDRITNITSMFPDKIAIEDNKKNEITYSTLLRKADIFARFLCEKNVVRNDNSKKNRNDSMCVGNNKSWSNIFDCR